MERNWSRAGVELVLHEVMAEPIVHLVMRRDRLTADDVWAVINEAQRRQRLRTEAAGASGSALAGDGELQPDRHPLCAISTLCEGILPLAGSTVALAVLFALLTMLR